MGQTIAAQVSLSQGEINVLARILSALEGCGDGAGELRVVDREALLLSEDEDTDFVRARTKLVMLTQEER